MNSEIMNERQINFVTSANIKYDYNTFYKEKPNNETTLYHVVLLL